MNGWLREYLRDLAETMAPLMLAVAICMAGTAIILLV